MDNNNDKFIEGLKERLKEKELNTKPIADPFEGMSDEAIKVFKNVPVYKEAYEESRLIRKFNALKQQEYEKEKQSVNEIEAKLKFPELRQENSSFKIRVQQAMKRYGINWMAAAKLIRAEGE